MFTWFRRLRARVRYGSFDADLRQEIETHRAMVEQDLQAGGVASIHWTVELDSHFKWLVGVVVAAFGTVAGLVLRH